MNEILQWKMLSAEQSFDPADRLRATDDHGARFANLREIFANLQSPHRDLSIDTLSSFAASKGECRDGEAPPVEDRDPG